MNFRNSKLILLFSLLILYPINKTCAQIINKPDSFTTNKVVPSEKQIDYQAMEIIGFIHYTLNTYTGKEWGYGDESPTLLNPAHLDVEQWVRVAKEAGMKQLILTAKHHDGFCLWHTKYSEHSIKTSPYKNGKGDIVKEFTDACRKHGIKAGLYLSPWDRNHAEYGKKDYIEYFENQLKELLTNYGQINEIWFDGANGGDGYYGGAREERPTVNEKYYPWDEITDMIYSLQPQINIFSDNGPEIRWIGNESGYAGETCWSMINRSKVPRGNAGPVMSYLNQGDEYGTDWVVGQCDVSIRPGWFYHENEDSKLKTPQQLVDLYYKSIGRNAVLLLNLPPNKDGVIPSQDVASLKEFRSILNETFSNNLAMGTKVTTNNASEKASKYTPSLITDKDPNSFWAADNSAKTPEINIYLNGVKQFDRILLQEPIRYGQRIAKFEVQALINNQWQTISSATTIGYKKLLRFPLVKTNQIRIMFLEFNNVPAISNVAIYKSSSRESLNNKSVTRIPVSFKKVNWSITGNMNKQLSATLIDNNLNQVIEDVFTKPYNIILDLGKEEKISGFYYVPRADGKNKGIIDRYSIMISNNAKNWESVITNREFSNIVNNPIAQIIKFDKKRNGRYVKFVAERVTDRGKTVSFIELGAF